MGNLIQPTVPNLLLKQQAHLRLWIGKSLTMQSLYVGLPVTDIMTMLAAHKKWQFATVCQSQWFDKLVRPLQHLLVKYNSLCSTVYNPPEPTDHSQPGKGRSPSIKGRRPKKGSSIKLSQIWPLTKWVRVL